MDNKKRYGIGFILSFMILISGVFTFTGDNIYAKNSFYDGSLPGVIIRAEILDSNSEIPIENAEVKFKDKYGAVCGDTFSGADGIIVFGVSVSIKEPTEIEVRAKDYYSVKGSFPLSRLKKHTANSWDEPLTEEEKSSFVFEYNPSEAVFIKVETSTDSADEYFEKVKNGEYQQYHSGNLLIPISIKMRKIEKEIR